MSKVRVVLAEMEGSDEAVLGAIRTFVGMTDAVPTPPIVVREIAAQADPPQLAAVTASAPGDPAAPQAPPRAARAAGKPKRANAPAPAAAPETQADSGAVAKIVAVLSKGPRTSGELCQLTGYSSGSVYPALKRLRDDGRIEMVTDERDGQRKNKLVS